MLGLRLPPLKNGRPPTWRQAQQAITAYRQNIFVGRRLDTVPNAYRLMRPILMSYEVKKYR